MNKNYIKMNNNEEFLSLGNLFRIIKEESKSKLSALQSEIFFSIFGIYVNDTTVNNYCVGIRNINDEYKQIIINKQKKYENNKEIFIDIVLKILSILEGKIVDNLTIKEINNNDNFKNLVNRLYNVSKNDNFVKLELKNKLNEFINNNEYYDTFVEILIYTILINKQPLYEFDLNKNKIEEILKNSILSFKGLEDYLNLTLNGNVNHDFTLRKLASDGNPYACYEMGIKEYNGLIRGYPRYVEAFKYLNTAANVGHAGALYTIGSMYLKNKIMSKNNEENAYKYFKEAIDKGSIAALNSMGLMYKEGIYVKKNLNKALELFTKAADKSCVYACNNLGKYYELTNQDKSFNYYLKSANLGESWACNKVGTYYLNILNDEKNAYYYFLEALNSDYLHICYYAYYNLAIYFYKYGNVLCHINKDENKYLEYLNIASNRDVYEASLELFYYYLEKYNEEKIDSTYEKILEYKQILENHSKFSLKEKQKIEQIIKKINNKLTIEF